MKSYFKFNYLLLLVSQFFLLIQCQPYDRNKLVDEMHKAVHTGLALDPFAMELTKRYDTAYGITSMHMSSRQKQMIIMFILNDNYHVDYYIDVEMNGNMIVSINKDSAVMYVRKVSDVASGGLSVSFSDTIKLGNKEMQILYNNNFDFGLVGVKYLNTKFAGIQDHFFHSARPWRK